MTALSGSGPAYVFYFVEAMMQAAVDMGLSASQGRTLALATFAGATELAQQLGRSARASCASASRPRAARPTPRISSLEADGVKAAFVKADARRAAAGARVGRRSA